MHFVDAKKVTKSHITVANVSSKINIPTQYVVINESETCKKRGRSIGLKIKFLKKKSSQ